MGIFSKKNSNNDGYQYVKTHKELLDYFIAQSWIDETVDLINNDTGDEEAQELNEVNIFKTKSNEQKLIKKLQNDIQLLNVELNKLKEKPSVFKEIVQPKKKPLNVIDDEYMKLVNTKGKIHPSIKEVCKIVESVISSLQSSSNYIDESDDDDLNESDFTIDFENQDDDPL